MDMSFNVCKLILLRGVSMRSNEKKQNHYLLMALGVSSRQTTYKYKGRESRADFASIALLELMEAEERPDTVLCLVTEDRSEERRVGIECSGQWARQKWCIARR